MNKWQQDILDFHKACGIPFKDKIGIPTIERTDLRINLIREEVNETIDGLETDDMVEIADGIIDSIVVLIGTAIEYGIDLEPLWDEVQRANLSKSKGPKRADGKQLKPDGWEPPNIEARLREQGW